MVLGRGLLLKCAWGARYLWLIDGIDEEVRLLEEHKVEEMVMDNRRGSHGL